MSNLWLLMKIQIQGILFRTTTHRNKKKKAAGFGMLILLAVVFMYMSVVYVSGMVMAFPEGYQYIALYIMGMVTIFMLLIFGYQSAGGHLFGFKDYDLLMSLPIKKSEVLVSKFLSFLVLEYFYGFFLLAPSIVIVGIVCKYGFMYYVLGLVAWLLIPLVPMVIAALLAYLSMYMAGKFKYKNLMNNIFYIILMGAVFVLIFAYQNLLGQEAGQLLDLLSNIERYLPFMSFLFDGMVFGDLLKYLLGILINVAVFGLFVGLLSKNFMKLNSQIQSGYKVKNFKLRATKANSSFKALFNKELRTYFSNTVYFMNTAVMPILLVIGFAYLCIFMREEMNIIRNMMPEIIMPVFCGAILLLALMSCTTNSSISLEGKNFDSLKSYPVDVMDIFMAKMSVNWLVIIPCALICSVMAVIFLNLSLGDFLLCVLTTLTSSFFISSLGLILNLHFYRLDWDNAAVVVKQSMPVWITTIGGMVVAIGIIFLGVQLTEYLSATMIVVLMNLVLLLFDIAFFVYLNKGGRKQFMKIH